MDNALVQATLGASKIATPAAPLIQAPAPATAEIQAAHALNWQVPESDFNTGVGVNQAQITVQQQKAAAAAAEKAARDKADPSKYQQVAKQDGGYAFFDPEGKEISASDYAHITNKSLADVLKNSQNPIDQGFINDYKNLQHYGELKANSGNDKNARAQAEAIEQQIKNAYGVDIHKMPIQDVIGAFKKQYPTVFGGQGAGTVNPSQSFIGNSATAKQAIDAAGGADYYNPYQPQTSGQTPTFNRGSAGGAGW